MKPEIELSSREHSSRYELKPMSRWWMVLALAFTAVMASASGLFAAHTWAMFAAGVLVAGFAALCFPKVFLTKDR